MKIRPHEKLWHIDLGEIWRYRDLIELFVRRNIVVQYKQTVLGPLWYLIQPILTVIMNMVVFGGIAKMSTDGMPQALFYMAGNDGMPQALFYMAGNICWFYFSYCLNQSSNTFIANQSMFGKVYFPRLVVPIAVVISNLLRFVIQVGLFVVLYLYFFVKGAPIAPNWTILLTPLLVMMLAGLGLGFGILISSLTTTLDVCYAYCLSTQYGGRRFPTHTDYGQPDDLYHRGFQVCDVRTGLFLLVRLRL